MAISKLNAAYAVALVQDGRSQRYFVQVPEFSQPCVLETCGRFLQIRS